MKFVGTEMVVKGPLGDRRYDIVVRDGNGKLHGLEVKSGSASENRGQTTVKFRDILDDELPYAILWKCRVHGNY